MASQRWPRLPPRLVPEDQGLWGRLTLMPSLTEAEDGEQGLIGAPPAPQD